MSVGLWLGRRASIRAALESLAGRGASQFALAFVGFLDGAGAGDRGSRATPLHFPAGDWPAVLSDGTWASERVSRHHQVACRRLETKDPYTRGHSIRVAMYATQIGQAMGLDEGAMERLEYAALLHDLGKLALPGQILTKADTLTDEEMDAMRGHPAAGAAMVERSATAGACATVLRHHEYYGGGGYPSGATRRLDSIVRHGSCQWPTPLTR